MSSESIIAGYFASGDDAHRAINALLDDGFMASQIGAAFHSSGSATSGSEGEASAETDATTAGTFDETRRDVDTSPGGASSGTYAVQPVGLASGTGSPILGAGKPGPISGSSLAHTGLPSELKSELAHDQTGSDQTGYDQTVYDQPSSAPASFSSSSPVANTASSIEPTPHAGSGPQHHAGKADTSWTAKLKHLFQSKSETPSAPASTTPAAASTTKESQNFGTGEGHLNLTAPYGHPYSSAAFESSASRAGVPSEHSRHLSRRLSGGGAVVTVNATGRATDVEKIFERHNGVVRFASDVFNDSPAADYEPRVEVFGHLEHHYPAR